MMEADSDEIISGDKSSIFTDDFLHSLRHYDMSIVIIRITIIVNIIKFSSCTPRFCDAFW